MLERSLSSRLYTTTYRICRQTTRSFRIRPRCRLHVRPSSSHHGVFRLERPAWRSAIEPNAAAELRERGNGLERDERHFPARAPNPLLPPKSLVQLGNIPSQGRERVRSGIFAIKLTRVHGQQRFEYDSVKRVARIWTRKLSSRNTLEDQDFLAAVVAGAADSQNGAESTPIVSNHLFSALMDEVPQEQYKVPQPLDLLRKTLQDQVPEDSDSGEYERAWQLFLQLEHQDRSQRLLVSLINYLSFSTREIDDIRTRFLLGSAHSETSSSYWSIIVTQLRRGSFDAAVSTHDRAIKTSTKGYTGTNILLAHLLHRCQWGLAIQVYSTKITHTLEADKDWLQDDRTNIWDLADRLPNLMKLTIRFLFFANSRLDYSTSTVRDFINQISVKAGLLGIRQKSPHDVLRLVRALQSMRLDTPQLYEVLIAKVASSMISSDLFQPRFMTSHLLLRNLYNQYRAIPGIRLSTSTLFHVAEVIIGKAVLHHRDWRIDRTNVLSDLHHVYGTASLPPQVLRLVIQMHARRGAVDLVQKIFDELCIGGSVDDVAARALLAAHAKTGGCEKAFHHFKHLQTEFGWKPDAGAWSLIIQAFSRDGAMAECYKIFNLMLASDITIDATIASALAKLGASRGDAKIIIDVLEEAKVNGVSIDIGLFSWLVLAHVNSGNLSAAEDAAMALTTAWEQGQLEGSIVVVWNHVLHGVALQKDIREANRIFQYMLDHKVEPDTITYQELIVALCGSNKTDAAWGLLTITMPQKDVHVLPGHYVWVMKGYQKKGQLDQALEAYEHMENTGLEPNGAAKAEYIIAKSERELTRHPSSRPKGSDEKLKVELRDLLRTFTEDKKDQIFAVGALIVHYASAGQFGMVEDWLETFRENRHHAFNVPYDAPLPMVLLASLMQAHYKAGKYEEVLRYWELYVKKAESAARALPFSVSGTALEMDSSDLIDLESGSEGAQGPDVMSAAGQLPPLSTSKDSTFLDAEPTDRLMHGSQPGRPDGDGPSDQIPSKVGHKDEHDIANQDTASPEVYLQPISIIPKPTDDVILTIAPSHRHILSFPLVLVIKSVLALRRPNSREIISLTITDLLRRGWTLLNWTWNIYVQALVSKTPVTEFADDTRDDESSMNGVKDSSVENNDRGEMERTKDAIIEEDPNLQNSLSNRSLLSSDATLIGDEAIHNEDALRNSKTLLFPDYVSPVLEHVSLVSEPASHFLEAPVGVNSSPVSESASTFSDGALQVFEDLSPVLKDSVPVQEGSISLEDKAKPLLENASAFLKNATPNVDDTVSFPEQAPPILKGPPPVLENVSPELEESLPPLKDARSSLEDAQPVTENVFSVPRSGSKSELEAYDPEFTQNAVEKPVSPPRDLEMPLDDDSPTPSQILTAFRIVEDLLMPQFPGWVSNPQPLRGQQKLSQYRGEFYWMRTDRLDRGRDLLAPQLHTLLDLKDCLNEVADRVDYDLRQPIEPEVERTSQDENDDEESEPVSVILSETDPVVRKASVLGIFPAELTHSNLPAKILLQIIQRYAPKTISALKTMPKIQVRPNHNPGEYSDRMGWIVRSPTKSRWLWDDRNSGDGRKGRDPRGQLGWRPSKLGLDGWTDTDDLRMDVERRNKWKF